MFDDGDRILDLAGLVLAGFVVFAVGVVVFQGMAGPSPESSTAPPGNWSLFRINDSHVQVAYDGPEAVDTADLAVTVDGAERNVSWPSTIRPKDPVVLRVPPNRSLAIHWTGGPNRITLAEWNATETGG